MHSHNTRFAANKSNQVDQSTNMLILNDIGLELNLFDNKSLSVSEKMFISTRIFNKVIQNPTIFQNVKIRDAIQNKVNQFSWQHRNGVFKNKNIDSIIYKEFVSTLYKLQSII